MKANTINESENSLMKESMIDFFLERGQSSKIIIPNHPVAKMQHQSLKKEEMNKMRRYADLYGSGLTFQYVIERNALANMRRMYPLKSNNFGLNLHMGTYDKVDFKDFLGKNKPFDVDEALFRKIEQFYFE